jgi:hypothetical protein
VVPRTRRQRRRRTGDPERGRPADDADAAVPPVEQPPVGRSHSRESRRQGDHGLRGLETVRSTQLTPTAAMRAREFANPTAEDLAEAEREVVLVRRNYVPPTPLQTAKKGGRRRRGQSGSTGATGSVS